MWRFSISYFYIFFLAVDGRENFTFFVPAGFFRKKNNWISQPFSILPHLNKWLLKQKELKWFQLINWIKANWSDLYMKLISSLFFDSLYIFRFLLPLPVEFRDFFWQLIRILFQIRCNLRLINWDIVAVLHELWGMFEYSMGNFLRSVLVNFNFKIFYGCLRLQYWRSKYCCKKNLKLCLPRGL